MFIDQTFIIVNAGNGGNGCFAYLREKYRPRGGPSGGNGGRGGHIYFMGSHHLHTLQDAAYHKKLAAARGQHGMGSNKFGKDAKDITIPLPLGTVVYDAESGELLLDCIAEGEKVIIARGGRGGRGNASLVSRKNPLPPRAEEGFPGEVKRLRLELKMLADVGLVGRPNAGKSTLLSCISKAKPKVAAYPFTTMQPYLGYVSIPGTYESFVVADIPGIIEDSHKGKGLGIRFLRHIERTKVLAIMVDALAENPLAEAKLLVKELRAYSPELAKKPKIYILTKNDIIDPDVKTVLPRGWISISAVTGNNMSELVMRFWKTVVSERAKAPDPLDFIEADK